MKYHYFHGRFTYSVKRSGPRRVWFLRGSRRRRGLILALKRVRSATARAGFGACWARRRFGVVGFSGVSRSARVGTELIP